MITWYSCCLKEQIPFEHQLPSLRILPFVSSFSLPLQGVIFSQTKHTIRGTLLCKGRCIHSTQRQEPGSL